jgi:hypothetical protein
MNNKQCTFTFLIFFLCLKSTFSIGNNIVTDSILIIDQAENIRATTELYTTATSNGVVPFWMRSNQFGSIPSEGLSTNLVATLYKDYKQGNKALVDWGFGLNLRANIGTVTELIPVEAYLKGRLSIFQLKAGRSKDYSGMTDPELSSGSFSLSGNALGIPNIEISVPEFWYIPYTQQLIAFKGRLSHGWMGDVKVYNGEFYSNFFYHLDIYGQLGKPNWKLKLYGGINHDAIWGSDDKVFKEEYFLTNYLQAYWYVTLGKNLNTEHISKIGNHLGSIDAGFSYETDQFIFLFYRQQFYDKGALVHFANAIDGLNNMTITNKKFKPYSQVWSWNKFLLEIFYSKNQAGEEGAKETASGPEYYYNHYVYAEGYSYQGLSLGNPFITVTKDARAGQSHAPVNYFINNRVLAIHLATTGSIGGCNYTAKLSFSRNWGDYRTSGVRYQWFQGKRVEQEYPYGIFTPVNQFSGYLEANRPIGNGYSVGAAVAVDQGKLLNNSVGGFLKLVKKW